MDIASAFEEVIRDQAIIHPSGKSPASSDAVTRLASSILEYARRDPTTLPVALRSALTEATRRVDRVSIAVTGLAWLGAGIPSVEQEMTSLVRSARRELTLCAYSITSGAMTFLREMREVAAQGVTVKLIVNDFSHQAADVQRYLKDALRAFPQCWKLLDFAPPNGRSELHAKLLTVDRSAALIGSANLSFHGMFSNHEMAIVLRGPTAEVMAARLDMLAHGGSANAVEL